VLGAAIIGRRLGPVVVVTAGLMGLALAATAFATSDALVLGLLALVGASRALFDIATRSLLQRAVAADMVARVFGLVEGLTLAGAAIGALLVPLLVNIGTGGAVSLSSSSRQSCPVSWSVVCGRSFGSMRRRMCQ
jgi:hypothetical protein